MSVDMMPVPVLERQTADYGLNILNGVPLLRQASIPDEIESVPSPKPEPLETIEDYAVKTEHGMNYLALNGRWILTGPSSEFHCLNEHP